MTMRYILSPMATVYLNPKSAEIIKPEEMKMTRRQIWRFYNLLKDEQQLGYVIK